MRDFYFGQRLLLVAFDLLFCPLRPSFGWSSSFEKGELCLSCPKLSNNAQKVGDGWDDDDNSDLDLVEKK